MATTTCAKHRSVFDLLPSDEAVTGLREVDPVLQTGCIQTASPGVYEPLLWILEFRHYC